MRQQFWHMRRRLGIPRKAALLSVFRASGPVRGAIWRTEAMLRDQSSETRAANDWVRETLAGLDRSAAYADGLAMFWKLFLDGMAVESVLEVGSFEGASAVLFARLFPDCRITCVDSFAGERDFEGKLDDSFQTIEARFDRNTDSLGERVRKIKGMSFPVLSRLLCDETTRFDLIYLDGSHHAADLMIDTYLAWPLLRPRGVLIWDDYEWELASYRGYNPKRAIDHFVRENAGLLEIVFAIGNQVCVRKIADFPR